MKWTLKALSSELNNSEFNVQEDTLVGRHQSCGLILQSSEISRKHAAFYIKNQTLWLEDLQSSNGTYVNGNKITAQTALKDQDTIQFATLQFILFVEDVASKEVLEEKVVDEGMPSLAERAKETPLSKDGMPQNIEVPQPPPIPEGADVHAKESVDSKQSSVDSNSVSMPENHETKKNASVGLITIVVILFVALLLWFLFK